MLFNRLYHQMSRLFPFHKPSRYVRSRGSNVRMTERLEDRVLLTTETFTWDGGGSDSNWTTAENWVGDVVPDEGSHLVFPEGAARLTNNNNFDSGTYFTNVTIASAGYSIGGSSTVLYGTLQATYSTGVSSISLDLELGALVPQTIDVGGGSLQLLGVLSGGSSDMTKAGAGTLLLGGSASNTFAGTINVDDGTLSLNKDSGAIALAANVSVGGSMRGNESLILGASNQIDDLAGVHLEDGATFDLNGNSEYIGALSMKGGTVKIGTGAKLTVPTYITTFASTRSTPNLIDGAGTFDLDGNATFSINVEDDASLINDLTMSVAITNGGISKITSGTVLLSGTNTYDGPTDVQAGVINVQNNSALGSTVGSTTVADGASLYFSGSDLTVAEDLTIGGLGYSGTGALYTMSDDTTLTGDITLSGDSLLMTASAATLSLEGDITDSTNTFGLSIYTAVDGRVTLSGDNTFDGDVDVLAGLLRLGSNNALGTPSTISTATVDSSSSLELAGGITVPSKKSIVLKGTPVLGSNKLVNVSGNNTITGSVSLENNNQSMLVASGETLILSGAISGSTNLDKNGPGTVILSGDSDMTGRINVGEGLLQVDGDVSTASLIFVDGTLAGTGYTGPVSVSSIGILAPGEPGGWGALHTGNVSLPNDSTFRVGFQDADDGIDFDQLSVTGTVDLGTQRGNLVIDMDAHPMVGETYTIINNDGDDGVMGFFKNYPEGTEIEFGNFTMVISYKGGTDHNDVTLTVAKATYTWDGGSMDDGSWSSPENWVGDVVPTEGADLIFPEGASRLTNFNDLGEGTRFVSITVEAAGYNLTGDQIDLDWKLVASYAAGTSTISLNINADDSSRIDVNGGMLQLNGVLSGDNSGGIVKYGTGTLQLGGSTSNTYEGTIYVNAGTLSLNKDSGAIALSGSVNVGSAGGASEMLILEGPGQISDIMDVDLNNGATFDLNGHSTYIGSLTLEAGKVLIGSGVTLKVASGISTFTSHDPTPNSIEGAGTLDLDNNSLFTIRTRYDAGYYGDLTISTVIANGGIQKEDEGTLALTAANTYAGLTEVNGGVLRVENSSALGTSAGNTSVAVGASLVFSGTDLMVAENISITGNGTTDPALLNNVAGNNTLTGSLTVSGNPTISVAASSTLTLSGGASSTSSNLYKSGEGTLILSGNGSISGSIYVNEGPLHLDANYSTTMVTISSIVRGDGGSSSLLEISDDAILAPGTSVEGSSGTLSARFLSFYNDSRFQVDLNGTEAGSQYDQVVVQNGVDLESLSTLLEITLGYLPTVGDSFTIIDNNADDGILGNFKDLPEGAAIEVDNVTMVITYHGGTDGKDVMLTVTEVTPPTYTWDGGSIDDSSWSNPENWVGDVAPTAGADLIFPEGAARLTNYNDFAANMDFHNVTVAANYNFSGNVIDLTGNITTQAEVTTEIGFDINLLADTVFDVGTGDLTLTGAITGQFGVAKAGGGNLHYEGTGSNTYTGATTINGGVLLLNKANSATAITGDLTIGRSNSVELQSSNQIADTATIAIYEGATWYLGIYNEQIATLIMQGSTVDTGEGVLTLTGTFTAYIPDNEMMSWIKGDGTLSLGNSPSFEMAIADSDNVVDARISVPISNGAIQKTDTGVLGFSGANTYAGTTSIVGGAITAENSLALGSTAGSTIIYDGASLFFTGEDILIAEDISAEGNGRLGGGVLRAVHGPVTLTGNVSISGDITVGANSESTLTIAGNIDDESTSGGITINSRPTGRVVLSGANTFDGAVDVQSGYLQLGSSGALGSPESITTLHMGVYSTLELAGGISLPATKSIALDGLAVDMPGSSKLVNVSGVNSIAGNISLAANNLDFNISTGTELTISGVISGSLDLGIGGTGILIISGNTAIAGSINLFSGTLYANASLASSSLVFVNGMLRGTGTLPDVEVGSAGTLSPGNSPGIIPTDDLNFSYGSYYAVQLNGTAAGTGYDQTDVTGTVNLADANLAVELGASADVGQVFTIINNDGDDPIEGTFNGLPEGSELTVGSTTFIVSYLGGGVGGHDGNDVTLTVSAVTATWDGEGETDYWTNAKNWVGDIAPGAGADLIFPAGALQMFASNDFALDTHFQSITIEGNLYFISGNRFELEGQLSFATSGRASLSTPIVLGASSVVEVGSGCALQLENVLSGSHGLTKTGGGQLVIEGSTSNTYTGKTTVSGGYVVTIKSGSVAIPGDLEVTNGASVTLYADGQIADTSNVTLSNGMLNLNDKSDTIASLTLTGGEAKSGTGTLTIASGMITTLASSEHSVISGNLTLSGVVNVFEVAQGTTDDATDLTVSAVISSAASIGKSGSGKLVLSGFNTYLGETVITDGILSLTTNTAASTNTIRIYGQGTLDVTGGINVANDIFTTTGAVAIRTSEGDNILSGDVLFTGPLSIYVSGDTSLEITQPMSDGGNQKSLEQYGSGTLILSGVSTYTGSTTVVAGGTLIVNGSIASSSYLTVTGTLGGSGIVPDVTIAADSISVTNNKLSPGNSPGILTTGDLVLGAGSDYVVQLTSATAGTGYDQTDVHGTVDLTGADLQFSLDYSPLAGDSYVLINNDGDDAVVGTFNGMPEGKIFVRDNSVLQLTYQGGTDHNDVVLTVIDVSFSWVGGSEDGPYWSIPENWSQNAVPTPGATLYFLSTGHPGGYESTNDLTPGIAYNSITISKEGYDISGNAIGLKNGLTTVNSKGSIAFDVPVELLAHTEINVATGGTLALGGEISGEYQLVKSGAGVLVFGTANSYTGATFVSAGTLRVDADNSDSSQMSVSGTLSGSSTVSGVTINAGGRLSPGPDAATLTSGDLEFTATAVYVVDINGSSAYDQMKVYGSVDLAGATLQLLPTYTTAPGDAFTIIDNDETDAVIGTFADLPEGTTVTIGGRDFRITYAGGDGNDVVLFSAQPPTAIDLDDSSIAESSPVGTEVGTFSTVDPDEEDTFIYTLVNGEGDDDNDLFTIDANGNLLSAAIFDYETQTSYSIRVRSTDSAGFWIEDEFTITVTAVNDNAPVFTSPTSYEVAENSTLVGTINATDSDKPPQTVTYAIVPGGDSTLFTIDPVTGVLSFITAPNYESPSDGNGDNVYALTISASDGEGAPATQNIEVTVTQVNEFAPIFTSSATYLVAENLTTIGTVHATDDDLPPQTVTYSITGGVDSSKFQIDPNTGALTFITAPDYENPTDDGDDNVYNVEVTASDNDGKTTIQAISVSITPVNDNSPFFTSPDAFNIAENSTAVGTVVATDADKPPQTVTYSITGGVDAAQFSIDSTTGALTFKNAPDYESPTDDGENNVYNVIVTANDGSGLTTPQSITITVTPVDDNAPVFAGSSPFTVSEGVTTVGTIIATDADEPDATITYSISGGVDAALFFIDPTTGVLSFLTAPDYEHPADVGANNSYEVQVSANDGTHTTAEDLTVNVTNTVEEPVITLNPEMGTYYLGKTDAFVDPVAQYQADVTETDYSHATLTVSITVNRQSKDQLAISGQGDKPGQINVKGKKIYFGELEIGTFKGGKKSNPDLVITFNSAASEAAVQALVKRVTFYVKNGKMPQPTRTVQMQLTNVSEHNSNAATRQIEVLEHN